MNRWKVYERIVALLSTEKYDEPSFTIIPNTRITGLISNRKRQIDVLIDYRFEHDLRRRMIIDAKERKRPIDIKDVESFEGMMKDVGAQRGILICTNGYTKAAKSRAQKHIGIEILPEEEIDTFNFNAWDNCLYQKCKDGLVLWDRYFGVSIQDSPAYVIVTGKCDLCHKFHIWCWSCGNRKVLENEDEWQCSCKEPWFWLTAIEPEEDNTKSVYLLFCSAGDIKIIDRMPL